MLQTPSKTMLDSSPLSETLWDAVIAGTSLREALLAAALSRSGKHVLHVDKNTYYGAEHGAFSVDELKSWVAKANGDTSPHKPFRDAKLRVEEGLRASREYTISLTPGVLY